MKHSDQRVAAGCVAWCFALTLLLGGCADNMAPDSAPPKAAEETEQSESPPRSPWTIRTTDRDAFQAASSTTGPTESGAVVSAGGAVIPGRLSANSSISFAGTYTRISPVYGTILLDLEPESLEAAWTLDSDLGGFWSGVGDSEVDSLPAAQYTVTWSAVTGWQAPPAESVQLAAGGTVTLTGLYAAIPDTTPPTTIAIPTPEDWSDEGIVLASGAAGDWDAILWGGFGATAVRREGTTFFYYQGSEDYDEALGTVIYRTIGLATSPDGRTFTKYASNPVLTWFPQDMPEEGAASAAAWASDNGTVRVFFGANTAISTTEVTADGRFAEAANGFDFGESARAIDHADPSVFGSGDEIFPVAAFEAAGSTYCYYIPNGSAATGQLCVAWGPDPSSLDRSAPVVADGTSVMAWGPSAAIQLDQETWAIFVTSRPDEHSDIVHTDVYRMSPESPAEVTGPVQVYAFPEGNRGTVLLDTDSATWFNYYRAAEGVGYGLRTAPVRQE